MVSEKHVRGLRTEWRRKLALAGFKDIERPDGQLATPDVAKNQPGKQSNPERAHAVERNNHAAYFTKATQIMALRGFWRLRPDTRAAWKLHAQGQSNREIAKELGLTLKKVRIAVTAVRKMAKLPLSASERTNHS